MVEAFILAMECDGEALGEDRTLTLPSRQYFVRDMISALERVAEQKGIMLGKIIDQPDPLVIKVVEGWPIGTESKRAEALGMSADSSVEEVIEAYLEDFHEVSGQA